LAADHHPRPSMPAGAGEGCACAAPRPEGSAKLGAARRAAEHGAAVLHDAADVRAPAAAFMVSASSPA